MSATFHAEGSNSQNTSQASFSITNTISTSDSLVVVSTWDSASTTTPTVVTTGGTGSDSLTLIYGPFTSGAFKYGGWLLQSAGAGRTGVTLTWASSSPGTSDGSCWSFSGLASPALDGSGFDTGTISAITSVDTATLLSADEFAVGFSAATSAVISADAPWIDDGVVPTTNSWAEHRILAATTAIHTNFTKFAGGGTWITFCLTFRAAPVTAFTGYVFGVGQSPSAPTTKMIGY